MEDNKPSYGEIEKELEEYKTLLWQLSDEYKLNVGNADKKIAKLEARCKELEKLQSQSVNVEEKPIEQAENKETDDLSVISNSGIASCIINKEGKIINTNNKFKFLAELLAFDIENLNNLSQLFEKSDNKELPERFKSFQESEELIFQSLFNAKTSLNSTVNMMLRINPCTDENNYLTMFIELNGINDNITENEKVADKEKITEALVDEYKCNNEIEIFAEKYEVYQKLLKVFGSKKRKKPEVLPENMYIAFVRAFNLEQNRNNILKDLNEDYKDFSEKLKRRFARLTNNEEKHCMLIKAGLSYKEIAAIMNISVNGVKIARNRLRKKLRIDSETTSDFINNL